MRCSNCQGPAHPATGHYQGGASWLCHRCAGRFFAWVVEFTARKGRAGKRKRAKRPPGYPEPLFYLHAATSVKAP